MHCSLYVQLTVRIRLTIQYNKVEFYLHGWISNEAKGGSSKLGARTPWLPLDCFFVVSGSSRLNVDEDRLPLQSENKVSVRPASQSTLFNMFSYILFKSKRAERPLTLQWGSDAPAALLPLTVPTLTTNFARCWFSLCCTRHLEQFACRRDVTWQLWIWFSVTPKAITFYIITQGPVITWDSYDSAVCIMPCLHVK